MSVMLLRIAATVVSFGTFLGILAWACSRRNAAGFDQAARIPFEGEDGGRQP